MSTDPRHQRGRDAEGIACSYLTGHGLVPVERNWRCRHGELDLIMRDERSLVIVEVRCRLGRPATDAAASVTPRKLSKLRAAALAFMSRSGLGERMPVRLDVLAIGGDLQDPEIRWIRNIG